ncbi:MAG TPA: hypothetical protein DC060_15355 [Gemmatimonadetes bacterium]|nr:hypothetical protein [Gemmatimonadota bacterium]
MTVPDFQTWFLPLLRLLRNGEVHRIRDAYQILGDEMQLSPEDRAEVLPSGKQQKYINRIAWARTYLKKAGLLASPGRGLVQITDRGKDLLGDPPDRLNVKFLKQYSEFREFHEYKGEPGDDSVGLVSEEIDETPEDILERVHRSLRNELAEELLERVKQAPPP